MSIERLQAHYGFTRMPFGWNLAPSMLHRHPGHGEALARITWCVDQHALGVITGEVGAGKTVAVRAATAGLDTSRHVVIYLPNPSVGVRGMLHHIVAALDQRVSVRYALAGMTAQDTASYLTHHLKIAGRADTLFSSDAVTVIHNAARGYPRAVNTLAITALTAAFARNSAIVDETAARIAVTENGGD